MIQKKSNAALVGFTKEQKDKAKKLLATKVAMMMGRKLEEGDWSEVYCKAKGVPESSWSNLNIDINHNGLGVEHKALCCNLNGKSIKAVCGTTLMHPSATRSIRIASLDRDANDVMLEVFTQYADLIKNRTEQVRKKTPDTVPDMRTGWLLWEPSLTEFLYFEERMQAPSADQYYAEWNVRPARGSRKESKNLWIYDRASERKRFSVTTSAGIKIQPYFDVPLPSDENLCHFRVQSEPIDENSVQIWVSSSTARALENELGTLEIDIVSAAIIDASGNFEAPEGHINDEVESFARPIIITKEANDVLFETWGGVSDEHRAQLFLKTLVSSI